MDLHSVHQRLITVASEMGFVQSSEGDLGRFMRLLVASRPGGRFLELGTGVGFGGLGGWMGWTGWDVKGQVRIKQVRGGMMD